MEIAANLSRLMEARGMSRADLARSTGLSSSQISCLVNGDSTDPRLSTLSKIALALECPVNELIAEPHASSRTRRTFEPRDDAPGNQSPAFYGQRKYRDILNMYAGRAPTAVEWRLSTSLRAEVREKPFDQVTVNAVCRRAQVSRRTFYRHFLDKYDLLTWTFYHDLCVNIEHHDDWVSWDYVPVTCAYFERDRGFYRNACQVRGPNSLREFASARMFPLAKHDFAGFGVPEVQLDTFIERSIAMVYDSIEYWLIEEPDVSAELFSLRFRSKMTQLLQRLLDTIKRPPAT